MNRHETDRGTAPFLLEIGSEEIPARFTPTAMTEMARSSVNMGRMCTASPPWAWPSKARRWRSWKRMITSAGQSDGMARP